MELSYEVGKEDWLDFSDYNAKSSPTVRRSIRKNQVFSSLALLIVFGVFALLAKSIGFAVLGVIATSLFFAYLPSHIRQKTRQQLQQMIDEGNSQSILGSKQMCIDPTGITIASKDSESTLSWSAIDRVESTDSHTFVYVSAISALIVPKHKVSAGDYERFVERLRKLIEPSDD